MGRHEDSARSVAQQARVAVATATLPPAVKALLGGDPFGPLAGLVGNLTAVIVTQAAALDRLEAERAA